MEQLSDNNSEDLTHLKILSICHYVSGGLSMLAGTIPVIHVVLGIVMLAGGFPPANNGEEVPVFVGIIFVVAGLLGIVIGWTLGILEVMVGRYLAAQRRRTFCFVMAIIQCLWFPIGTVLGVFTIIVLNRPSVRAMFDANS